MEEEAREEGAGLLGGWAGDQDGGGATFAYITVLPQARDAEGLQEVTATQEQDAQLYGRQPGRRKETQETWAQ